MRTEGKRQPAAPARRRSLNRLAAWALQWGPALGLSAAIYWLSSSPKLGRPNLVVTFLADLFGDRAWFSRVLPIVQRLDAASSWLAHFAEFALLALAWRWALHGVQIQRRHKSLLAWLLTALYAVADEWHQSFVPGRHADWRDVAVDIAGATFALAALAFIRRRRNSRAGKP
jgi:VanZ family protein